MLTLILIGLVGGLITGISPCVLPVLPVVFLSSGVQNTRARPVPRQAATKQGRRAQSSEPSRARPYLIVAGLAISFSVFTLLGTLALSALPLPKDIIRWTGLTVLVLLGIAMMFPRVQDVLEKPFARIGQRRVSGERGGFVLGLALGAVYVPCAGPVLAAITVAGATGKIGLRTVALTVAFAIGTAIPLLGFALAGRQVAHRVAAFRTRQRSVRVVAGLVVIGLAVALTFNVTDALQRTVPDYTSGLNKALNSKGAAKELDPGQSESLQDCGQEPASTLQNCGKSPQISGIQQWINTPGGAALTAGSLQGKVVLVDFWAYSCINCQRAIPHVEAWYSAYQSLGFEVVGVHTPEYAFEHVASNVRAGADRLHITYPVAIDNNYTTWNNFSNDSWPAEYLIDATGLVRHVSIGEGDYAGTEALIRQLLTAANPGATLPAATDVPDTTPDRPEPDARDVPRVGAREHVRRSRRPPERHALVLVPVERSGRRVRTHGHLDRGRRIPDCEGECRHPIELRCGRCVSRRRGHRDDHGDRRRAHDQLSGVGRPRHLHARIRQHVEPSHVDRDPFARPRGIFIHVRLAMFF